MPIYMQYGPKGKIKGNVTEKGHTDWIALTSFNWGVGRGIGSPTGQAANREASAPSVSEITVSKTMDKASFALLQEALKGAGMECTIHFATTDKNELRTYAEYKLTNCLISGYSTSSGGDRPSETLSINFTKVEFLFVELGIDNANSDTPRVSYDLAQAVAG
ncbi:MAG: type VI secretion system tube protein Hcp [Planctomycetes bacterium]|nr:type VI secretion system tube protein Hcp [Planctomycetota bacterium]